MATITRNTEVRYSQRQMFELVNDIEAYPRFLPWCQKSQILVRDDKMVEAELEVAWSGMHKSFTTRNQLVPYERIDLHLVSGPFRHLEGIWRFVEIPNEGCRVHLDLEFEFAGGFLDKLFQPIFHHMANSMVDLFCKRAVDIYGTS